jgi:signal transduction histidine kinase/streptogramin lyase
MTRLADGTVRNHDVPQALVMAEDPTDGYWLGTNLDGLFHFNQQGPDVDLRRYPLPDGNRNFRVRSIHVDLDGNIWVGTDADGLLRLRRRVFTTYTSSHGLSHDVTTAVLVDSAGAVWSGTNCAGVNVIDPQRKTVRLFKPRQRNDPTGDPCVFSLAEGPPGTLWVGTYGGGITRVTGEHEERLYGAGGLPDSVVLALFTDREETVWVGMGSGGLAALDHGRVRQRWTTRDGLADNGVRTIQQTRDGALWIGTLGGLSRFQDGRFVNYTATDGLSSGHVRAIHEDKDGTLWIGTYGGGINRFRDGVFTPITREDGLADNVVSAILEDHLGRFWMSGNRGIARVSRAELSAFADGRIARVRSVLYGIGDGLPNPETNGGFQSAAAKDGAGRLWFPTLGGLAMVDPARVVTDARPPPVRIEEVVVDGVSQPPDARVVVGPGRPNLEFRYTGLSLTDPEHLTFRYRLEGFERDWVEVGTRRVAYYPQLPPGDYRFTVSAANRDGVWNEAGAALELRVVPPFWRTLWFQIFLTVAVVGLVGAGSRWRYIASRREREARQELSRRLIEGQELERKRIAGELHDGLGQELLVVKNRALLALRSPGLDTAAREQLRQIDDVVARSLESVRSLAHNLRPHQLEHLGLTSALQAMVEAMATAVEINIESAVRNIDGLLSTEAEINLYRVVQEALTNLVRHSSAHSAEVSVRRVADTIEVVIVDDGRGFDSRHSARGEPGGGFGMRGMAERVRILNGSMELTSAPGRGTRIRVVVPVDPVPPPTNGQEKFE